jgi:MFS family permease
MMTSELRRTRAVRYGAAPLVALAATLVLGAGETGSLSQAVNGIQRSFHVSDATVAILPVAMSVVGVLGAIPFGFMADSRRRTFVLAAAMLAWTACMGLNGLAWGFGVLLAFRIGVGFAEASSSASISLLADYYPVAERAVRMGWYQAGSIVGALVGFVGGGIAVSLGGWRWAFWFWVPLGVAVIGFLLAQPEPKRGGQDLDFENDRAAAELGASLPAGEGHDPMLGAESAALAFAGRLPPPRRVGTLDYRTASLKDIGRELLRIPSMWWALVSLTVAQCLTSALSFWAIPFFERVDHLKPVAAGAFTGILLPTAMAGVIGGGILSDRLTRRGVVNARIYVVVVASVMASISLPIGFATHNLLLSALALVVGGCSVTMPVAPSEALFNDVVVADLRGRAASVRSIVRAVSSVGSLIVGIMADHLGGSTAGHAAGLQHALVIFAPICGIAGVAFIFARRSYAHDVAFVCAETARLEAIRAADEGGVDGFVTSRTEDLP